MNKSSNQKTEQLSIGIVKSLIGFSLLVGIAIGMIVAALIVQVTLQVIKAIA